VALEEATGVAISLATASHSAGVAFDPAVRAAFGPLPAVTCFAGHDAGIVAERRPAGMVLVRNATGVSHAPEEEVDLEDAAAGANALRHALEALA
jgi:beta-ureidopropionase / N-carbamoyl-L-amino-acid hydrolase